MISGKRNRKVSSLHLLGQNPLIPKLIHEDRLLLLVMKLRGGDQSVHEEIAIGHIRLAISIATQYVRIARQKVDELISEALYGLIYAVKHAQVKLVDDNITAYISGCCHRRVKNFICRDRLIPIAQNTYWRRKKRGLETETLDIHALNGHTPTVKGRCSLYDLKEMIKFTADDETDIKIIKYRTEGYNDREISEKLNCSRPCIEKRRREIRQRFEKLEREYQ